ncbi:hypothetical protein ABPG74_020048 [Tetrahymena malaccensis]
MGQCQCPNNVQNSQIDEHNTISQEIQNKVNVEKNEQINISQINQLVQVKREKTMQINISEISNQEIQLISDILCNNLNLSCLTMKFNVKEQNECFSLANLLQEQKNQTNLVLNFKQLGLEGILLITDSLKTLKNLISLSLTVYLNLSYKENNFKVVKPISDSLVFLKSLTCLSLKLWLAEKYDEEFIDLVNSIKYCQKITNLSLSVRHLSKPQSMNSLLDTLYNLRYLSDLTLDFQNSYFRDLKTDIFSNDNRNKNSKITKLSINLTNSQINDERIKFITSILQNNKLITHLELQLGPIKSDLTIYYFMSDQRYQLNNIGIQGTQYLCQSIKNLQDLVSLNLNMSCNNIGPKGAEQISFCLLNCQKLTNLSLNLSNCQLQLGRKSIINSIEKCKKMVTLNLNFNHNAYLNYEQDLMEITKLEKRISKMKRLTTKQFTYEHGYEIFDLEELL